MRKPRASVSQLSASLEAVVEKHTAAAEASKRGELLQSLQTMSASLMAKLSKLVDNVDDDESSALAAPAEPVNRELIASNDELRARLEELEDDVASIRSRVLEKSAAKLADQLRAATEEAQQSLGPRGATAAAAAAAQQQQFEREVESKFDEVASTMDGVASDARDLAQRGDAALVKGAGMMSAAEQARSGSGASRRSPARSTVPAQSRTARKERPY